jgi:rRNA processing protein Gar1
MSEPKSSNLIEEIKNILYHDSNLSESTDKIIELITPILNSYNINKKEQTETQAETEETIGGRRKKSLKKRNRRRRKSKTSKR